MYIEEYVANKQDELKTDITVAYYNAYFQRAKKMPELNKILDNLGNSKNKKEMTDSEMFDLVQRLHKQFGGE